MMEATVVCIKFADSVRGVGLPSAADCRLRPPHSCRAMPARVRRHFPPSHAPLCLASATVRWSAPYTTDASRRACEQNWIAMFVSS